MTKDQFKKIMLRHSLCWGWAFVTPPIVMVILDMLDRHTPTSVALFSAMMLMMPFIFSNAFLTKELMPLVESEEPTS